MTMRPITISQRLAMMVNDNPGQTPVTYHARLGEGTPNSVATTLRKLRQDGMVTSTPCKVGRYYTLTYQPTPELTALLARGERPYPGKSWQGSDEDHWTPQPWVHPYSQAAKRMKARSR